MEAEEWYAYRDRIDAFFSFPENREKVVRINALPKEEVELTSPNPKDRSGHVYIIKADNGLYKVGRTKDLSGRIEHFTVKLPYDFEVVHHYFSEDYVAEEKRLHKLFDSKRVRGEWFKLKKKDLDFI